MTRTDHVRDDLQKLQKSLRVQLGRAIPAKEQRSFSPEDFESYLKSNPDYDESDIAGFVQEAADSPLAEARPDLSRLDAADRYSILGERVLELKKAAANLGYVDEFDSICFATIPGGGLDAYSFRSNAAEEFGVVVPEGFFHLTNLLCRLVILLQPWTPTPSGLVYTPRASMDQFLLPANPYCHFRHADMFRAYFLHGDPVAALPYKTALPYQDRLAYLLVGTEIYLLAHEVAHILLGHLSDAPSAPSPERELEADELALRITTEYFRSEGDFPEARASLCATLFLSMTKMWENSLHSLLDAEIDQQHLSTHPPFEERARFFADSMKGGSETPPWYIFIHNAIRIATDIMTTAQLESLLTAQERPKLSARVLPATLMHLGHFGTVDETIWWKTMAKLLASPDNSEQLLGLWFLNEHVPMSAIGLFDGVMSDDPEIRDLSKKALVFVEPMYEDYMPRLEERFRETEQQDQLMEYKFNISGWLAVGASRKLGKRRLAEGPVSAAFFEAGDD